MQRDYQKHRTYHKGSNLLYRYTTQIDIFLIRYHVQRPTPPTVRMSKTVKPDAKLAIFSTGVWKSCI